MSSFDTVAMILAGGQGSRLGVLTKDLAKPAVHFGGKYRIIDFPLTNCAHSGLDTVGVLTQYQPLELNTYIGNGQDWDLDRKNGGVYILPPYMKSKNTDWYKGTANAIYQNANFVDLFNAKYILVLSGDHIYKMDYAKMIRKHIATGADATIAVYEVPWDDASRYGILTADANDQIAEFAEKPKKPNSNLASMGIYVFTWEKLKEYLAKDDADMKSNNDFGKNIIPKMLDDNSRMFVYRFDGYWKDVGTIFSLWEANMDMLREDCELNLRDMDWRIFSKNMSNPPEYVDVQGEIDDAYVSDGCEILGTVRNCIISDGVKIGKNAVIEDSVIMANVEIGENTYIKKSMVDVNTVVGDRVLLGVNKSDLKKLPTDITDAVDIDKVEINEDFKSKICSKGVSVVGRDLKISNDKAFCPNSMVDASI